MSTIIDTVQLQSTEEALITLFDLTLTNGTIVYFVNGLENGENNIYFSTKVLDTNSQSATYNKYPLNEYIAIPIEISGIETASSGAANRPTLSLANIPILARALSNNGNGTEDETTLQDVLENEGIVSNEDLLGSRIVVRKTFLSKAYKSTDTAPSSSPVEFPSQTYILDRVGAENNVLVEFELASPMDIEGVKLPNRIVVGKYCPWRYQGHFVEESNSTSPSKDGGCTWPLDSNGRFFDVNNNVITKNISTISTWSNSTSYNKDDKVKTITKNHTQIWIALRSVPTNKDPEKQKSYWKRLDVCGKTLESCKVRFQGNNTNNLLRTQYVLPFGGFPGSRQFR